MSGRTRVNEKLVSANEKTIHPRHTDQFRTLPLGAPMIKMGFTKDGQLRKALVEERNKRFTISTEKNEKAGKTSPLPNVDPMANARYKPAFSI